MKKLKNCAIIIIYTEWYFYLVVCERRNVKNDRKKYKNFKRNRKF